MDEEILQELQQSNNYLFQIGQNQSASYNQDLILFEQIHQINESLLQNQYQLLVYSGCTNLILMIMLLISLLPRRKGVLKK